MIVLSSAAGVIIRCQQRFGFRLLRRFSPVDALSNSRYLHFRHLISHPNTSGRLLFIPQSPIRSFAPISRMENGSGAARVSTLSNGSHDGADLVSFQLSPTSSLKIQKGDITRWSVDGSSDAIVNPANERMLGGGGADGAIHRAAGPELREACYRVPEVRPGVRCPTGEARITPGFRLPSSHVIHTVGPIYDSDRNPEASLSNAYRNSLRVAKENNIQYIAFPAISCGVYGYPFDEAASVAISTVKSSADGLKEVHFVLFSDDIYDAWLKAARELIRD
ncbi:OLC1v1026968C1 [Oldenlandia corymbosa var. corymbosa]|uniref:OLC1v1026968C1 n=1 Tax=Oldenlandia corymbosa var. corymbosa TaxID=529605 RepID=A0AAV1C936_OLDCO|nr:OLC1v1026968C1 [Oldenlandia corymbosa var. corymbosa]